MFLSQCWDVETLATTRIHTSNLYEIFHLTKMTKIKSYFHTIVLKNPLSPAYCIYSINWSVCYVKSEEKQATFSHIVEDKSLRWVMEIKLRDRNPFLSFESRFTIHWDRSMMARLMAIWLHGIKIFSVFTSLYNTIEWNCIWF